jgi:hypothetical protein
VSLCVPPIVARQRLGVSITAATNIHATVRELLDASFYIPSVSCQRRVYGFVYVSQILVRDELKAPRAVVFYAVRVVPKEIRQSVITRTSCYFVVLF